MFCAKPISSKKARPLPILLLLALLGPGAGAALFGQLAVKPEGAAQQKEALHPETQERAPVVFEGEPLFDAAGLNAEKRAEDISRNLEKLANDIFFDPDLVTLEDQGSNSFFVYRGRVIGKVTEEDAEIMGVPRQKLAAEYLGIMQEAIKRYREHRAPQALTKAFITTGVGGALLALLLGGLVFGHRKFMARVETWRASGKCVRYQNRVLVDPDRLARIGRRSVKSALVVLGAFLGIIYLEIVFTVFPLTRAFTVGLLWYVLDPLASLWRGLLGQVGNVAFIAVVVIIARCLLKGIKWLHVEAAAGALHLPWVTQEWSMPVYKIVRLVVLAFTAVIIYPYIPGSQTAAFKGISIFAGVMVSLGSSGSVGHFMGGLILMGMRAFRIGDRVEVGGVTGDVVATSLTYTRIRTSKNEEVTVPNGSILGGRLVNYSEQARQAGLILHTSVTIGYDAPWRTVHGLLVRAALRTEHVLPEPAPFVLQTALNDFFVTYEINAYTREANRMATIYGELHQNIQDSFNEGGVEIMSPHYSSIRDGNAATIPEPNRPEGYRAPRFGVDLGQDAGMEKK
jgi:small-conductance mechanosensitive channel